MYHPFTRQITPATTNFQQTTSAMDKLLESIILREQEQFHAGKMTFWSYIRNNTTNGQTRFPLGQIAAISHVFGALCQNMSQQEKDALFVTEECNIKCSKCNRSRNSINTYSTYFLHNTNIHMTDVVNSTYDPLKIVEKMMNQQDVSCSQRSICLRSIDDSSICGGNLVQSSSLVNTPFLMPVELDKDESRPVQPCFSSKLHLNIGKYKYDLAAIIYHHNYHFWCEVFVSDKRYKDGWYLYNDMWNNGRAEYIGKQPQVKTPSHMYILLFEKSHANITTSCTKDHSASVKNIMSMACQRTITSDAKQVKQNYLTILKFSGILVHETASCKELRAQLLENEQRILNTLKRTKTASTQSTSLNIDNSIMKRKNEQSEDSASPKKARFD